MDQSHDELYITWCGIKKEALGQDVTLVEEHDQKHVFESKKIVTFHM